jgi:hypothetical protein
MANASQIPASRAISGIATREMSASQVGAKVLTTGICEDEIAGNGFQRVCLPKDLDVGATCSFKYQCLVSGE